MTWTPAWPLAAEAEKVAAKIRHRKFAWCRLHNGFIDMALWRVVAAELAMPLYQIQAFATRLDSLANAAIPRGYVGDFCAAEFGAALGMPAEEAARIFAALEEPAVGWIGQEHVITFWERNPDKEDSTAAERQRKSRANAKGQKLSTGHAVTGGHTVTACDKRDVTHRAEQRSTGDLVDNFSEGGAVGQEGASDGQGGRKSSELWLGQQGFRLVVDRLKVYPTVADMRVERWRRDLDGDTAALAGILRAAEAARVIGSQFLRLVEDEIRRHREAAKGPRLPLPPMLVAKEGGEG